MMVQATWQADRLGSSIVVSIGQPSLEGLQRQGGTKQYDATRATVEQRAVGPHDHFLCLSDWLYLK